MELLEKVLSKENLNRAYKQVYKNKGASGVDGVTVDELFAYIKEHKEEILWQIRNRKYKPQPVRRVYIPKENGKMRKLGIPSVIDRVIQQAIVQVFMKNNFLIIHMVLDQIAVVKWRSLKHWNILMMAMTG